MSLSEIKSENAIVKSDKLQRNMECVSCVLDRDGDVQTRAEFHSIRYRGSCLCHVQVLLEIDYRPLLVGLIYLLFVIFAKVRKLLKCLSCAVAHITSIL